MRKGMLTILSIIDVGGECHVVPVRSMTMRWWLVDLDLDNKERKGVSQVDQEARPCRYLAPSNVFVCLVF